MKTIVNVSAAGRQPAVQCPNCGHGLFSVEDVSALTGESTRTLQRRLEVGAIPGAIREQVPGGFRWLIPLEAVQGRVATVIPPLLEKVIPEAEAARDSEERRIAAQRLGLQVEAESARRDADDALLRAAQQSREAMEWFNELQGWVIDRESAPLIMALQRSGIDFRRGLYAQSPEDRISAIDGLITHLRDAIELCRRYQSKEHSPA